MKKAVVLKAPGTNNDCETRYALEKAGADPRIVHINRIASGEVNLDDFSIMVIPGGFSYGDELGAGKLFSLFLKYRFRESFERFIRKGKLVAGICNGFQVLLKTGVFNLPDSSQRLTLTRNDCGDFVCRWVELKVDTDKFWFRGLEDRIKLPVAHAEGKFTGEREALESLRENGQIALQYLDNPNGSSLDIAGIVSSQGNVLGLMPHPERYLFGYQYPGPRRERQVPWGIQIYRNMVENA